MSYQLGADFEYCEGCNTYWVDTGCGQPAEHERCPVLCGCCGKPITGREGPDDCQGHRIEESRAALARRRGL